MNEISNKNTEISPTELQDFKSIKPKEITNLSEADKFWNNEIISAEKPAEVKDEQSNMDLVNEPDSPQAMELKEYTNTNEINPTKEEPKRLETINENLENNVHPETKVPFVKKTVELPNGGVVEAVVPEFDSEFDATIPIDIYTKSDKEHFKACNKQLYEKIEKNKELREKFSEEQIEQIREGMEDGSAPDGYVWHHDAEPGKIQLVDAETHAKTAHTGGRAIWGGGSENR